MRSLFALTLALLAACSPAPQARVVENSGSITDLESKTVALARIREDGSARAYCSGVWVGAKSILTAAHCLGVDEEQDPFIAVKDDILDVNGREFPLVVLRPTRLVATDAAHDLAILEMRDQTPPHEIARVGLDGVRQGAKVLTMGHPLGLWWSYSSGDISAIRFLDLEQDVPGYIFVQTTAPTSKGNSGCGLFDTRGFLIGIAHAGMPAGSNLAFYVHGQYVASFLKGQGL